EPGVLAPDHVSPESLVGLDRRQVHPKRWEGAGWAAFVVDVRAAGVELVEEGPVRGMFSTDGGGMAYGMPHGVVIARSAAQISSLLKAAQAHRVPVFFFNDTATTE